MDQAFDTGFEFDERTVVGDVRDATHVDRFQRIVPLDRIPGIFLKLLHAKRDAVRFLVDLDDLDFHRLTDRHDFRRMVDAAPGHVGDVQQTIDTAEIDEGAVFGDVLDHAVHGIAFLDFRDDLGALFGAGFFQDGAARNNDVATATVHFQDLERLLQTHQRASVAHGAHIDLRAGQERDGTAQIDGKAAFHATEDCTFDAGVVGIGFFQLVPGGFAAGLVAADDRFATRVFHAVKVDLDLVAHFDFGGFTGICEFFEFDTAFHLVADVDDGLSRFDRDDLAFDNRPFVGRVDFEAFVQEGLELLHGCISHVALRFLLFRFTGRVVVSTGL